jgi:hypothetical protein
MERNKRMLSGLAAAGVLAGALAVGGVALADTGGPAQPAAVTVAVAAPAAGAPAAATATGKGGVRFLRRARAARMVFRTSTAYLGLTPAGLRAQLKAGKSLAAIATARGKSVSGLENAIVARAVERVDHSKLTTTRRAAVIADVKANVAAFVNATHPFERAAHRLGKAGPAAPAPGSSASTSAT